MTSASETNIRNDKSRIKSACELWSGHVVFEFLHMGLCGQPIAASHAGSVIGGLTAYAVVLFKPMIQRQVVSFLERGRVIPMDQTAPLSLNLHYYHNSGPLYLPLDHTAQHHHCMPMRNGPTEVERTQPKRRQTTECKFKDALFSEPPSC